MPSGFRHSCREETSSEGPAASVVLGDERLQRSVQVGHVDPVVHHVQQELVHLKLQNTARGKEHVHPIPVTARDKKKCSRNVLSNTSDDGS
eukprot:9497018-Pyramimonas_sp.AAC.1